MPAPYSVLMAVYRNDSPKCFVDSVESMMNQETPPQEILIVRDGPVPDEIQYALKSFKATAPGLFSIEELAVNRGLAFALNHGLEVCRNELIARQDSDDVSETTRMTKQLQVLSRDANVVLVSGWYDQYDEKMKLKLCVRKVPERTSHVVKFARHRTPFNHACATFRKSAVVSVGGYPKIDGLAEDWWLALRLLKARKDICNIQESLVRVRSGRDFYQRRRGYSYIKQEVENQFAMYREGLLSAQDVFINLLIRTPCRFLPAGMLEFLYHRVARH